MAEAIEQTGIVSVAMIMTGKGIQSGSESENGQGMATRKGPIAGAVGLLPLEDETAEKMTNPTPQART